MIIITEIGLFYYNENRVTPLNQIPQFVELFDGVILLSTGEGRHADSLSLIEVAKSFSDESPLDFEIWAEIPYYSNNGTPRSLQDAIRWIDTIEASPISSRVTGYYFSLEGAASVLEDLDKIRDIVRYIKDAYKKSTLWIPIERWDNSEPFTLTRKCLTKVEFDIVAPQPHYYMVKDTEGDYYRPNGMTYDDLNEFMWFCWENGFSVEMEWDSAVRGYCEHCGYGCDAQKCTERARDYLLARRDIERRFGNFPYVVYYFSNDINNYLKVVKR